ncbi:hypothetical protein ASC89_11390 [Devosia sp. Root413D1]|uniref:hypothetical protein n=1 Tax=Devosia sp. Root413D1 TaxID=1736531 RepID=UPI0006FA8523|nr:hypothetical protein [Devosia sp. Root413D1]KQW80643.1 hypothetical protein ASC89_11390 [Devosia sp. Root413D1]
MPAIMHARARRASLATTLPNTLAALPHHVRPWAVAAQPALVSYERQVFGAFEDKVSRAPKLAFVKFGRIFA